MRLHEYLKLMPEGEELTVWDKDYDMESYFYGRKPRDKWDEMLHDLSRLLVVTEIRSDGIVVNLSEMIAKHIDELGKARLFVECDVESIMNDMEGILSGYVSEEWFKEFVESLE